MPPKENKNNNTSENFNENLQYGNKIIQGASAVGNLAPGLKATVTLIDIGANINDIDESTKQQNLNGLTLNQARTCKLFGTGTSFILGLARGPLSQAAGLAASPETLGIGYPIAYGATSGSWIMVSDWLGQGVNNACRTGFYYNNNPSENYFQPTNQYLSPITVPDSQAGYFQKTLSSWPSYIQPTNQYWPNQSTGNKNTSSGQYWSTPVSQRGGQGGGGWGSTPNTQIPDDIRKRELLEGNADPDADIRKRELLEKYNDPDADIRKRELLGKIAENMRKKGGGGGGEDFTTTTSGGDLYKEALKEAGYGDDYSNLIRNMSYVDPTQRIITQGKNPPLSGDNRSSQPASSQPYNTTPNRTPSDQAIDQTLHPYIPSYSSTLNYSNYGYYEEKESYSYENGKIYEHVEYNYVPVSPSNSGDSPVGEFLGSLITKAFKAIFSGW